MFFCVCFPLISVCIVVRIVFLCAYDSVVCVERCFCVFRFVFFRLLYVFYGAPEMCFFSDEFSDFCFCNFGEFL